MHSFKLSIAIVLLFSAFAISSPAYAESQLNGAVSDPDYDTLQLALQEKIKQLETRGGGTKPFLVRLDEINKVNESGSTGDAITQIKSLTYSVDDQLKTLTALRAAPKSPAAKAVQKVQKVQVVQHGQSQQQPAAANNLSQMLADYAQSHPAKAASFNYASFQGSANDYVQQVAKDILSRELAGLPAPCEGPFRLERFRNLQRISELKKTGQNYENFLSYHRQTEEVAAGSKNSPMRVAECSQRVRYLEQQLGLSPLQSSLSINQF